MAVPHPPSNPGPRPAQVLNGMGVTGELEGHPLYTPTDSGGKHLMLQFEYSAVRAYTQPPPCKHRV
jgi:hypothetical protein